MSNVVSFPDQKAAADSWSRIARAARIEATTLLEAVDELEREGHQTGSDAIGLALATLSRLHGEWAEETCNWLKGATGTYPVKLPSGAWPEDGDDG